MSRVRVTLTAYSDDTALITRTAEHLSRTALGLALDGVETFMTIAPDDTEEPL